TLVSTHTAAPRYRACLRLGGNRQQHPLRSRRTITQNFVWSRRRHNQMKAQRITMKTSTSVRRATARFVLSASLAALLAACATQSPTPSRIPNQTADTTWKDGLFSQPLSLEHTRPGCRGECPALKVQSLIFPGVPELTNLIDRTLADMTPVAGETQPSYQT